MSALRSPLLWLALAFFVAVKAGWSLLPVDTLQSPRLGDDAQVYLWTGHGALPTAKDETAGVASIRAISSVPSSDEDVQAWRDRVGLRMTGVSASPLAMLTGALLHAGVSPALTFGLIETFTALILGIGIAVFLSRLASPHAAAFALTVLALAILPRQGFHFLVPSVFALGVSMVAWGLLLGDRIRTPALIAVIALACALAVSVHTIGKAYVMIALGIAALAPSFENKRITIEIPSIAAVLIGALAGFAVEHAPGTRAPASNLSAGLDPSAFLDNALAFLGDCAGLAVGQPVLAAVIVVGLVLAIKAGSIGGKQVAAIVTITGALLTAGVVMLPGYDGELMSRMLGPLVVMLTGLAFFGVEALTNRWPIWAGLFIVTLASQAPVFSDTYITNINGRSAIYDDAELDSDLAMLQPGEPIVWLDSDTAMPAAFLAGAWSHPAYPAAALDPGSREWASLPGQKVALAGLPPQRLNSLSVIGVRNFDRRFYGWDFERFARIDIQTRGEPMRTPAIRLVDIETPPRVSAFNNDAPCRVSLAPLSRDGWARITPTNCEQIDAIRIETECNASCPNGSLRGFSPTGETGRLDWPWYAEETLIFAYPRDTEVETQTVLFNLASLLAANGLAGWETRLERPEFLADRSGLVWMRATLNADVAASE